jgi:ABC-2 type transport system ATP-binding protein
MDAVIVDKVRKTYPSGTCAIQEISLTIGQGEIFGVLGPNGAGKTTLLNSIATLLLPDAGDIRILGESVIIHPERVRRRINLCSGNANFAWSLTVRENLRFYAMLYGLKGEQREKKISALIDAFGLTDFANRRFDEASTGTKQRMALAKALINDPEVLLLDEPTVGLDPDIAQRVREYILEYHRSSGCTLVLTTHYMPEAQMLCQRIAFIREGKILALGTPEQLKTKLNARDMEGVFLELAR